MSESLVPTGFHPDRVISLAALERCRRNRDLDGQLASSTANGVRAADLVVRSGFHEINEPGRDLRLTLLPHWCLCRVIPFLGAEREDVVETLVLATICSKGCEQVPFSTEPVKRVVMRKRCVGPRLTANLALNRDPPQFSRQCGVLFHKNCVACSRIRPCVPESSLVGGRFRRSGRA